MPRFAFEYLDGGCFSEVNLDRNIRELREVQLQPYYLRKFAGACQKTELFGKEYDAPFGVAPVGLQGLMWPKACEYLALKTELLYKRSFDRLVPALAVLLQSFAGSQCSKGG